MLTLRRLEPSGLRRRLDLPSGPAGGLEEDAASVELAPYLRLVARDRSAGGKTAVPESDDSETSSDGERAAVAQRRATLAERRGARRLRKALDEASTAAQFGSLLEAASLRNKNTRSEYVKSLAEFQAGFGRDLGKETDEAVDDASTSYMNRCYMEGSRARKGERLVAALMALKPLLSRAGWRRWPRTLRALGWRILSPSLSRKPWDYAVWAGAATELVRMGEPLMANYVIMLVDG